ncbi:MAG: hydroxyacid dehydrogenase, partial [Clostridia bacterium]|nr:hydroxyacid dehydrogenase [Clostridia bacterium]
VANKVSPVFQEISSMTWGVVGVGGIGARVASLAKALGCRVIVCRRKKEEVYEQMELD